MKWLRDLKAEYALARRREFNRRVAKRVVKRRAEIREQRMRDEMETIILDALEAKLTSDGGTL